MKKTLLMLIAVIMSAYNLSSQNIRGCTYEIQTKKSFTVAGQAKEYSPVIKEESLQNEKTGDNKDWVLVDSIIINSYIHAGKYSGVSWQGKREGDGPPAPDPHIGSARWWVGENHWGGGGESHRPTI